MVTDLYLARGTNGLDFQVNRRDEYVEVDTQKRVVKVDGNTYALVGRVAEDGHAEFYRNPKIKSAQDAAPLPERVELEDGDEDGEDGDADDN